MLFPQLTERIQGKKLKEFLECQWFVVISKEKTKKMTELPVRPREKSSYFGSCLLIHLEILAVLSFNYVLQNGTS